MRLSVIFASIFIILFSISLISFEGFAQTVNNNDVKIFRITLVVPPNSINPLTLTTGNSGGILIGMEYFGSPIYLPNGSLDWQQSLFDWIWHNKNYTEWIFNIRPGLKWSNGQPVTSNDVLTTFGPSFGFNATYDYLDMHSEVVKEYALNSSAAVYILNTSDAHWADKFNWDLYSPVLPANFIESQGAASNNFGTDVVVGPFYVSNYSSGEITMEMLRNPYFSPLPKIQKIEINFVETLSLTTTYLESGSTDLAPVEYSAVQAVLKNPYIRILDEKGMLISDIQYNDSLYPYNMTAFRQALAYGINQSAFVSEALNGFGLPAYNAEGIVSPVASAWYNPNITKYQYDPQKALKLLASIGITKGSDGFLHYPNGTIVKLSLWADSDNTEDVIGASIIQTNLESLGFQVSLHITSLSNIVGDYSNNIDNIRAGMILTTNNPVVWGNPYLDALPGWDVYWPATVPDPYWEYPPKANNEYMGNYTAFLSTDNQTLERVYLDNIQALNAEYLPTLVLAYPDIVWGYNTQYWTNWPKGYIEFGGQIFNTTALAEIQPLNISTSIASTSTSTSASTSTSTSASTSTSTSASTSTSTSASTSTPNTVTDAIIVALALIVLIGVVLGLVYRRRR